MHVAGQFGRSGRRPDAPFGCSGRPVLLIWTLWTLNLDAQALNLDALDVKIRSFGCSGRPGTQFGRSGRPDSSIWTLWTPGAQFERPGTKFGRSGRPEGKFGRPDATLWMSRIEIRKSV